MTSQLHKIGLLQNANDNKLTQRSNKRKEKLFDLVGPLGFRIEYSKARITTWWHNREGESTSLDELFPKEFYCFLYSCRIQLALMGKEGHYNKNLSH